MDFCLCQAEKICHLRDIAPEILEIIIGYLNFEDIVNLRDARLFLFERLESEEFSHRIVKEHIPYSREGHLAEESLISYSKAVRQASIRKAAFAVAKPSSALILGYGRSYIYQNGVLCYHDADQGLIRILNVHKSCQTEKVIDFKRVPLQHDLRWTCLSLRLTDCVGVSGFAIEFLDYGDGFLSFLLVDRSGKALITIDTRENVSMVQGIQQRFRVLQLVGSVGLRRGTESNLPIRVRHTPEHFYYISNHKNYARDHQEWVFSQKEYDAREIPAGQGMRNLFRCWPGESVVFKIHGGYLYMLSNQSKVATLPSHGAAPIDDDDDGQSYYQCYRFPVNDCAIVCDSDEDQHYDPTPLQLEMVRIWRPQPQAEPDLGMIWEDLTLHEDEKTGELVIVESRPHLEPTDGAGYYSFQPLLFPTASETGPTTPLKIISDGLFRPHAGHYHIQGKEDKPQGSPNHEYPSFDPATTKHRAYNPSCSAFLDVTLDVKRTESSEDLHQAQKVRIHIGSRERVSPTDQTSGMLNNPSIRPISAITNEDKFRNRDVQVWPPPNAPPALSEMLNPFPAENCELRATSDERSIVYMVGPKGGDIYGDEGDLLGRENQAIILINFDAGIHFPGLQNMHIGKDSKAEAEVKDEVVAGMAQEKMEKNGDDIEARQGNLVDSGKEEESDGNPWFRTEPAMWMSRKRGFDITYE